MEKSIEELEMKDFYTCMEEHTEKYIKEGMGEVAADSMAFEACREFLPD